MSNDNDFRYRFYFYKFQYILFIQLANHTFQKNKKIKLTLHGSIRNTSVNNEEMCVIYYIRIIFKVQNELSELRLKIYK